MSIAGERSLKEGYCRLHVTPFRSDLLSAYLGTTLANLAENISYHSTETSPEKGFGYLDIPIMDAAKLKKKLHGAILKGQKVAIEDARPEKRKRHEDVDDDTATEDVKIKKKSKKTKASDGVITGHELADGRQIQRGWTETVAEKVKNKKDKKLKKDHSDKASKKEKRSREASKYTNEPECLFRTSLPNRNGQPTGDSTKEKKEKKKDKTVVVHEFSKTKKHASFLKNNHSDEAAAVTQEYVDGKGWVDPQGNVVEAETDKQRAKRERRERKERKVAAKQADGTSAEITLTGFETGKQNDKRPDNPVFILPEPQQPLRADSEGSVLEPAPVSEVKEVHPLEALFKRPPLPALDTQPAARTQQDFSFFGAGEDSDVEEEQTKSVRLEIPQTPFTKQDMEWRASRSAAPTPDTAAIGRNFPFNRSRHIEDENEDDDDEVAEEEEEEEDDDEANTAMLNEPSSLTNGLGISEGCVGKDNDNDERNKEESEFSKWFYDNRSENNKTWRARRRESMKLKRKRENRRLTRRIV